VIILTRLGGQAMAVNPDLIERAEPTPDTVITMIDGHKLVVAESLDEVVDQVRQWRASVAAEAFTLSRDIGPDDAATAYPSGAAGNSPALAQVLRMPAREV
jgi:flagellar protein FlbD